MSQIKIRNKAGALSRLINRMLAINGCLVLTFAFLLIFGHSHSLSSTIQADQFAVQTKLKIHDESDQPGKYPLESHQIPEVPDEVESNDHDDSSNKSLTDHFSFSQSKACSGSSILQHLKQSIEERPQVSLFVLHHSWKSFPS